MKEQLSNIYRDHTYEEISKEFQGLFPSVVHAFNLISEMYNRLTLVDKYPHKGAITKIFEDHKQLRGFSRRNIYRALPSDNPNVPRRVVPARHNSSDTDLIGSKELSPTKLYLQREKNAETKIRPELTKKSTEVECRTCTALYEKNQELEEALLASSGCRPANNITGNQIEFQIPKEKMNLVTEALEKSDKNCFLIFDSSGKFVYAAADNRR